jgi:hypothetical protein
VTKAELKQEIQKKGIESAMLDDTVHDAASSLGTDANNGGLDAQIDFLMDTCGWSAEDILKQI